MDNEIIDLIRKNLPAQVGDALREELADLGRLREQHAHNLEKIDMQTRMMADQRAALTRQEATIKAGGDLTQREIEVAKRELKQDLLLQKLEMTTAHKQEILGLVTTVFKGPVFTRAISGSIPVAVEGNRGGNGGYPSAGVAVSAPLSVTETVKVE